MAHSPLQVFMLVFALIFVVLEVRVHFKGGRKRTMTLFELANSFFVFIMAIIGFGYLTNAWNKTPSGPRTARSSNTC